MLCMYIGYEFAFGAPFILYLFSPFFSFFLCLSHCLFPLSPSISSLVLFFSSPPLSFLSLSAHIDTFNVLPCGFHLYGQLSPKKSHMQFTFILAHATDVLSDDAFHT